MMVFFRRIRMCGECERVINAHITKRDRQFLLEYPKIVVKQWSHKEQHSWVSIDGIVNAAVTQLIHHQQHLPYWAFEFIPEPYLKTFFYPMDCFLTFSKVVIPEISILRRLQIRLQRNFFSSIMILPFCFCSLCLFLSIDPNTKFTPFYSCFSSVYRCTKSKYQI